MSEDFFCFRALGGIQPLVSRSFQASSTRQTPFGEICLGQHLKAPASGNEYAVVYAVLISFLPGFDTVGQ